MPKMLMNKNLRRKPLGKTWRGLAGALAAATLCLTAVPAAIAAPEPDPIPTKWEFEFRPGPLRIATISTPETGPRMYYYFTYRVTNYWGRDLLFAPQFDLKTDEAEVMRSGRNVPTAVTKEILRRLDNPLMQDQIQVLGQVLEGEENARDGVVIWPVTDTQIDELMLFVGGLSGENSVYETTDPDSGEVTRYVLRKTMMLRYETPGSLRGHGSRPLELAEQRWVMR